ncbi:MAG: trigger factor [Holosporales bacterium]|jgi:trigger factor|nr:trigger factor [Thalassospira sp.]
MHVEITKTEGLLRELKVKIPASVWNTRADAKLLDLAGKVRIDGFRPGKIPAQVLRQRYGQSVRAEALEETVQESLGQALEQQKLKPALQPRINLEKLEGDSVEYTASVELFPEIPEIDLAAIKLSKNVVKIEDKDIDEAMEKIADNQVKFVDLSKKRGAKKGDQVTLNYTATDAANGAVLLEEQGVVAVLGKGQLFEAIDAALAGKKIGATEECTVDFTEDKARNEYAGKNVNFSLKLTDIKEPEEFELSDDFAKTAGFDDLGKMREAVGKQIENTYATNVRGLMKKELLDKLDGLSAFDLPPTLVANELEGILEEAKREKPDSDPAALKAEMTPIADRRVKLGLLLANIGQKENIEVTDEEVYRHIYATARQMGAAAQQVLKFYEGNAAAIQNVRAGIYEDKIIEFILGKITATEKSISRAAFDKKVASEDESDAAKVAPKSSKASKKTAAASEHVHDENCKH